MAAREAPTSAGSIDNILHQRVAGQEVLKFTDQDESVRQPDLEQGKSCIQSAADNDTQKLVSTERLSILQGSPAVLRLCGGVNEVDRFLQTVSWVYPTWHCIVDSYLRDNIELGPSYVLFYGLPLQPFDGQ